MWGAKPLTRAAFADGTPPHAVVDTRISRARGWFDPHVRFVLFQGPVRFAMVRARLCNGGDEGDEGERSE